MIESASSELRWVVEKRLEFIEFQLFWYGKFNRADLAKKFSISNQQASADVSEYEVRARGNARYDRVAKAFLRTEEFTPRFLVNSADRYLLQLMAVKNGWMDASETWFQDLPPMEVVDLPPKPADAVHLLRVLDAIREKLEIDVVYHSMTGSSHTEVRKLAPHALMHSGSKAYFRAWSRERANFRDYNFNRIASIGESRPAKVDSSLDFEWQHVVDLEFAPNPELSANERKAVEAEYDMIDGRFSKPFRLSLVFYLLDKYNLNVVPGTLPPQKQQLVLVNAEEVEKARESVRKLSIDALKRSGAG